MKLSFAPRTRSIRPRWLLEELGVPYEAVRGDPAEVPVLTDGEVVIDQTPAICLYLADRFLDRGFAPALDSPARGPYLQWVLFAEQALEPAVLAFLSMPEGARAAAGPQRARLEQLLSALEVRLAGREFLAGDSFSVADLVNASILHLANTLGLLEQHPALFTWTLRHASRPAVRRALER